MGGWCPGGEKGAHVDAAWVFFALVYVAFVGRALTIDVDLGLALQTTLTNLSGLILWQTSNIIHGGETNYIMATVTLYITIYNLFTSLLHLLGAFSGIPLFC